MTQLLTYPDIDPQQWQALIDRSPYATWFQTKEAYEFYAANPDEMMPFAIGVEEKECKVESLKFKGEENSEAETTASTPYTLHPTPALKGVIVGYITRERNAFKQYFTRRAIIYGGPLLANDISDEALSALLTSLTKLPSLQGGGGGRLTPIYIESRNFHDYSRWKEVFEKAGFNYQKHLNYHVDTTSIDHAQSNIGKHRWRYIRLSMRDGAQIVEHPTIEQVRAFYTILLELYRTKVKTPLW